MSQLKVQFNELINYISNNNKEDSLLLMNQATDSCSELLIWLDCLATHFQSSTALELLNGARSSMLEAVAYIGIGFGRATITAIRSQIDLLLAFTYFCDHPQEWDVVQKTGNGFMLRSDIHKYHQETKTNFTKKLALVDASEENSLTKVYRILSAHIHGQSPLTTPKSGHFKELFSSHEFITSLIELQQQVDRCLSNYLAVIFMEMNISPPSHVESRIKEQLTTKQRRIVFFEE